MMAGHTMPLLGFGVYQNYNTRPSVLTAFAAGYRYVIDALRNAVFQHHSESQCQCLGLIYWSL